MKLMRNGADTIVDIYNCRADKQRLSIIGGVKDAQDKLARLDSHPQGPDRKSPASRVSGANDGMLGSLVLDCLLGGVFSQATGGLLPAPLEGIDFSTAAEMADEYWMDRRRTCRYELGKSGKLADAWNASPTSQPERQQLEARLFRYKNELWLAA